MTDTFRRYLITDAQSLDWADDTFTRRAAAIEKAEEALQQIREIETTIRDAAGLLDSNDPTVYKLLSYPMSFDDLEGCLREDIAEWKRDQDELEAEIHRYQSRHTYTLDNTPDD